MFGTAVALIATFLLSPWAAALTTPWLTRHVIAGYGAAHISNLLLLWQLLLALLIFAAVRAALKLLFSAASLALAFKLIALLQGR